MRVSCTSRACSKMVIIGTPGPSGGRRCVRRSETFTSTDLVQSDLSMRTRGRPILRAQSSREWVKWKCCGPLRYGQQLPKRFWLEPEVPSPRVRTIADWVLGMSGSIAGRQQAAIWTYKVIAADIGHQRGCGYDAPTPTTISKSSNLLVQQHTDLTGQAWLCVEHCPATMSPARVAVKLYGAAQRGFRVPN